MSHEISELDIPDRLLLPAHARARVSTEIGEAVVTHSIFGRAKVRIIRKGDRMRRTVWVMALAVAAAAAMAAWQGWLASQQPELLQGTEPEPSLNATAQQSVPAAQPEYAAQPAVVPPLESKPLTSPQGEQNVVPAGPKSTQSQAQAAPDAVPVKPDAVPSMTRKLQTPAPAEGEIGAGKPANTQHPPKPAPKPAVTPTVATPRVMQPAAQVVPVDKEDAAAQAPAMDRPAADPVNAQP
jgi:hypothetical protein